MADESHWKVRCRNTETTGDKDSNPFGLDYVIAYMMHLLRTLFTESIRLKGFSHRRENISSFLKSFWGPFIFYWVVINDTCSIHNSLPSVQLSLFVHLKATVVTVRGRLVVSFWSRHLLEKGMSYWMATFHRFHFSIGCFLSPLLTTDEAFIYGWTRHDHSCQIQAQGF